MTTQGAHLLLLAGVGGHSPEDALDSLARLTDRVSVVFIDAWTDAAPVERDWGRRRLQGGFFVAGGLEDCVEVTADAHRRTPFDGVVTYSELLLRPQAEIVERLGLPGNSVESVRRAQSKVEQRLVFAECGVPSPGFAIVRRAADLPAAAASVGLPAVFKPSLGAGSSGVVMVHSVDEAAVAHARMIEAAGGPFLQSDEFALLEEHLPLEGGADSYFADYCSVESLLSDGRVLHAGITDRLRLRHGFVEEGGVMPSRLDAATRDAAHACAEAAIRSLGLTTGAVHTEVALLASGPKVIEVNARAGGPVPTMFETAAGYDYAAEAAKTALGIAPSAPPPPTRTAYWRMVPTPAGEWTVRAATPSADLLAAYPELVYFSPRCGPGAKLRSDVNLHVGSYMLRTASLQTAQEIAARLEAEWGLELASTTSDVAWRSGADLSP